LTQSEQAD